MWEQIHVAQFSVAQTGLIAFVAFIVGIAVCSYVFGPFPIWRQGLKFGYSGFTIGHRDNARHVSFHGRVEVPETEAADHYATRIGDAINAVVFPGENGSH